MELRAVYLIRCELALNKKANKSSVSLVLDASQRRTRVFDTTTEATTDMLDANKAECRE